MSHREVYWFERYAPPEPGMVLADEAVLNEGRRVLLVWTARDGRYGTEICCWTEPDHQLVYFPSREAAR